MAAPILDIMQAVYNAVLLAGIADLTASSVFRRERPERLKSDPGRICVLCPGKDRVHGRTNATVKLEYPVLVVLSDKDALTRSEVNEWEKEARYMLRRALWIPFLLGTSGIVRHCDYDSNPDYGTLGFAQNLLGSSQLFTYRTEETQPTGA